MARPSMTTPVETTVTVVRSAADWADEYRDQLQKVFGEGYDGTTKAEELADRLEEAEQAYVREQREDVGLTNRREQAVADASKLVSSGLALAQIAFTDADNLDDILADFAAEPPSRVRSPQTARKALTRLTAAVDIHHEPMARVLANLDEFRDKLETTVAALEEVAEEHATESQETRSARRGRDTARKKAVSFLRNFQLAAEAMEFFRPAAFEDLHAIFEAHNPTSPTRTGDEELSADAEDGPEQPEVEPEAPNSDGAPVGDDVTPEDEEEEPVEA